MGYSGCFAWLINELLTQLKYITNDYNSFIIFIVIFALISNLSKSAFEVFNYYYRKDKLLKLHSLTKKQLDKKYFWLLKPFDTFILVLYFNACAYICILLDINIILRIYFGLFVFYYFKILFANIVYFLVEIFMSDNEKMKLEEKIKEKKASNNEENKYPQLWTWVAIICTLGVIVNLTAKYIVYVSNNIVPVLFSLEIYVLTCVIEFALYTCDWNS